SVHHNRRRSEHPIAGDLHHVGDFFHISGHTTFCNRLFDHFFRLPAFGAAGAQDFDFHFHPLPSVFNLFAARRIQALSFALGGTTPTALTSPLITSAGVPITP